MRRFAPLMLCALVLGLGCDGKTTGETETTPPDRAQPPAKPKLVVVVVVDQMRADYFERYADQWTGGLARLGAEGRVFTAASHAHALTETAPGHATITTGCHPAAHGIVANSWYDRARDRKVDAIDDPEAEILGLPEACRGEGEAVDDGVSPAALLRESVGDWAQAANPDAIVVSISIKDRAAILMGGKRPDAAIWYDDCLGAYTSSSYYADALPAWVEAYNQDERAAALYGQTGWALERGPEDYDRSRLDTDPALVTRFNDYSLTLGFPHVIDPERGDKQPRNVIRDTPFGDQMTLELAREAIAAEGMGADAVPDLLLLSMSGGDYAGHRYGPFSAEIHDYYLRLDAALGAFVDDLDAGFGQDYVLLLTSDHGVAPMPEYDGKLRLEVGKGRFFGTQRLPPLIDQVNASLKLAEDQRPSFVYSHGVELLFPAGVDEATRARYRAALAELMRAEADVRDAWTRDELAGAESRNEHAQAWRRSFHPERSPDILTQVEPGVAFYPEGTGHGTPYAYDQHVPLIVRGPGLSGVVEAPVRTVDIAPTIAELLGVAVPEGVAGEALPLR